MIQRKPIRYSTLLLLDALVIIFVAMADHLALLCAYAYPKMGIFAPLKHDNVYIPLLIFLGNVYFSKGTKGIVVAACIAIVAYIIFYFAFLGSLATADYLGFTTGN